MKEKTMIYHRPSYVSISSRQLSAVRLQGSGLEINLVCGGGCPLPNDGGTANLGYACLTNNTAAFSFAIENANCAEFPSNIPDCQITFVDDDNFQQFDLQEDCTANFACSDAESCGSVFRLTCSSSGNLVCGAETQVTLTCDGISELCLASL